MSRKNFLIVLCAVLVFAEAIDFSQYREWRVYRAGPLNDLGFDILGRMEVETLTWDFWKSPSRGGFADICVHNAVEREELINFLQENDIEFELWMEDVEDKVAGSYYDLSKSGDNRAIDWTDYYSYNDIVTWLGELEATYGDRVSIESIGKTFENRDIMMIKIGKNFGSGKNIWIDAGIHAREWIAPAATTYVINELVTNPAYDALISALDIHIVPVANPDGYEFSRSANPDARMWRKTRSDYGNPLGCFGVDPNRNFEYHWGEGGTLDSQCSDIYLGPSPFSEPETRAISDYALTLNPPPPFAMSVHSYGQMVLIPWGYDVSSSNHYCQNYPQIECVAQKAADALEQVDQHTFQVGNSFEIYGAAAGATDDYYTGVVQHDAKGYGGFTIELRDKGRYGFLLPPDQIEMAGRELMAFTDVMFQNVISTTCPK